MYKLSTELLEIKKFTLGINELHNEISKKWIELNEDPYNLKKTQIRHICQNTSDPIIPEIVLDLDFRRYMNEYCGLLNDVYVHPDYEFLDSNLRFRSRIKDPDSRIAKILHYNSNKKEGGMVNLKKCLNDLMGFRIWVDGFEHNEESANILQQKLDISNIKVHNSTKGDYKATHIYFYNGNNQYFPWELQIWNNCDHDSNTLSHSIHKQAYTKWPSIYLELEGGNYSV